MNEMILHGVYFSSSKRQYDTICAPEAGPVILDPEQVTCKDCLKIMLERGHKP